MAVDPRIRFEDVAAAALAQAHVLLPEWMGGQRRGREWVAERKANGGLGDSWSVNLDTGRWGAYASGERGGDLVSLYAAIHHIENIAALPIVASLVGLNGSGVPVLGVTRFAAPAPANEPERPLELIPPDPGPLPGEVPTAIYQRYGNEFIIARYDPEGKGKTFLPWHWHRGQWKAGHGRRPYRLYNLEELASRPNGTVLIVEGEKTAEALIPILPTYIVMTWSHGASSIHKSDWTPLRGRHVLIWPDADLPGVKAGNKIKDLLEGIAASVRAIRPPADAGQGWDLADGVQSDWDAPRIEAWIEQDVSKKITSISASSDTSNVLGNGDSDVIEGKQSDSAFVSWASLGLDTNQGGLPYPTLANASKILQIHPRIKGKIWYDTFQRKIWHTLRGGVKYEWEDSDAADLTVFIQQSMCLPKFNMSLVQEAARHAARRDSRNSLTRWLDTLEWDGIERLDTWVGDILGCDLTAHSMAVSKNWLLSMVARAYVPGSQVDTMPVLEGYQGRGKSKFLEVLGGEWFGTVTTDIGELDFIQEIQGVWLVEIPDMTGFGRREHTQILSTITVRVDRYRPSYGRSVENRPRTCVLAATSETDDYLTDTRGRRRFWPLRCNDINLDTLHRQRDQLFAEAVVRYREGISWHQMPEETDLEQLDRMQDDLWTEQVLRYADTLPSQMSGGTMKVIAVPAYVLHDVLKIELSDQTHKEKTRVAGILQRAGWITSKHKGSRCWVKPKRGAPT